jgi:hypothetical protein
MIVQHYAEIAELRGVETTWQTSRMPPKVLYVWDFPLASQQDLPSQVYWDFSLALYVVVPRSAVLQNVGRPLTYVELYQYFW